MKLNKIIKALSALAILTLFFGCASTDDSVKEVVFDSGDTEEAAEQTTEEQEVTEADALLVTADEASSFQVDAVAPAGRDNKKNYTGWIASSVNPVTNVIGNIKLYSRPKKGTFSIQVMNDKEKAIPVFSTANEYTSTSFYLKAGKKIIKLCDDSSVVSAAKKTEKGLRIRYSVDKVAVVIIDFECFSSVEGENEDSIKVTAAIVSQSKKKTDFALKLLMDTVLGETDRHHFYDSEGLPVKNEVLYRSVTEEKYFTSQNAKAAMQIILSGVDTSPIESFALANFSTLDTKKWEADMTTFRSFDTVLSYNNSAAAIYWPKTSLEPEEETSFIFYLSLASDERTPGGAACIFSEEVAEEYAEEIAEEAGENAEALSAEPEREHVQSIEAVEEDTPLPVEDEPEVLEPVEEDVAPQNVEAVEEEDSGISSDKLSKDYIQSLIERIEELEEGDPSLNKDEINRLNAELDEIIAILNAQSGV